MSRLQESLLELVRRTSAELPEDVVSAIEASRAHEEDGGAGAYALKVIRDNIDLAKAASAPLCQDTGSILFFVHGPVGLDQIAYREAAEAAVRTATEKGYLRQNSVDPVTGANAGTNVGPGSPYLHFDPWRKPEVEVRLMLKGGGCENVGAQYALPDTRLGAGRDLEGVRRAVLDAVFQAQGKGCGPGILGVCVGGDRTTGYEASKMQLLRPLDDRNPDPTLDALEGTLVAEANRLGIGPMGFGGATTLLGCKIGLLNRLPASYFVSVSYMCWAYRRQGVRLDAREGIGGWLY
jgi:tartrate/fumarate subfamily iron-sulfur-dependent hydro-lyase alpha chain